MHISDVARRRLFHQRLARPDITTPGEVVRWFGAVQAQEYLHSLYAVGLRMPSSTEQRIEQAIADKQIVRTWPMRGTIHYIPAEDTRWMVKLLAQRPGGRQDSAAVSVYRRAGLTAAIFARAGDVLTKALQGGKLLTRKELYATLEAAGINTAGEQRGLHILGYWARAGLLCLGPRRGKQPTYTLLDEWIPHARALEGDEALATLARRYFTSHGPATEYDFAWWTGLTITEARHGLSLVERDLARDTIAGRTYWLSPAEPALPAAAGHGVYLLPPYDEFTVAYKQRDDLRDPAFPDDPFAILGPVIVVDGRVAGTWKRTLTKDAAILTVTLYTPLGSQQRAALAEAVARYGAFVGLPAIIAP
jgi:hypothetical protein